MDYSEHCEPRCRTILLSDDPAESDELASHQPIADAIGELIANECGGKAIGLRGSWGSGKSTVLKLLKEVLDQKSDKGPKQFKIFPFDAWSHQGDSLRKTFLQQLARYFGRGGAKSNFPASLEDHLQKLERRIDTTRTTTTPHVTYWGKWFAFSLILAPLSLIFSSLAGINSLLTSGVQMGFLLAALVLAVFPAIILTIALIWSRHSGSELLTLFLKTSDQSSFSTTERSEHPSSIEFQQCFSAIVDAYLGDPNTVLVVAIDNLDRLSPSEASLIWSDLRAFFDISKTEKTTWVDQFWLILAYQPSFPSHLMQANSSFEDKPKDFGHSFESKTLQICFDVPSPIHAHWKQFLINQLKTAFPDHELGELDLIYRLYRLRQDPTCDASHPPSQWDLAPRTLIRFVNQIGSLHRQWHSEASILVMADSVLFPIEDLGAALSDNTVTHLERFRDHYIGDSWILQRAVLKYNLPRAKAQHILLSGRIRSALEHADFDRLGGILPINGASDVLQTELEDAVHEWSNNDPRAIGNSALALHEAGRKFHIPRRMWDELADSFLDIETLSALDRTSGLGFRQICSRYPNNSRISKKLRQLLNRPNFSKDEDGNSAASIKEWTEGAVAILEGEGKKSEDGGDASSAHNCHFVELSITLPPEEYVLIADHAASITASRKTLVALAPESEVLQSLPAHIGISLEKGDFNWDPVTLVHFLTLHEGSAFKWSLIVDRIRALIESGEQPGEAHFQAVVSFLLTLASSLGNQKAIDLTKGASSDGTFFRYLPKYKPQETSRSVAALIAAILIYNPNGLDNSKDGHPQEAEIVKGRQLFFEVVEDPDSHAKLVANISKIFQEIAHSPHFYTWQRFHALDPLTPALNESGRTHGIAKIIGRSCLDAFKSRGIQPISQTGFISEFFLVSKILLPNRFHGYAQKTFWKTERSMAKFYEELLGQPFNWRHAPLYSSVMCVYKSWDIQEFVKKVESGLGRITSSDMPSTVEEIAEFGVFSKCCFINDVRFPRSFPATKQNLQLILTIAEAARNEGASSFIEDIVNPHIAAQDSDFWREALNRENAGLDLLDIGVEVIGPEVVPETTIYNILVDDTREYLADPASTELKISNSASCIWRYLPDALRTKGLRAIWDAIIDSMAKIDSVPNDVSPALELIGDSIEYAKLPKYTIDRIVRDVFPKFLARGIPSEIREMKRFVQAHDMLRMIDSHSKDDVLSNARETLYDLMSRKNKDEDDEEVIDTLKVMIQGIQSANKD